VDSLDKKVEANFEEIKNLISGLYSVIDKVQATKVTTASRENNDVEDDQSLQRSASVEDLELNIDAATENPEDLLNTTAHFGLGDGVRKGAKNIRRGTNFGVTYDHFGPGSQKGVSRIIQKQDFSGKLKKLEIGAYCDHMRALRDFEEETGVEVRLVSTLSLQIKNSLVFESESRPKTKEKRHPRDRGPFALEDLSKMSNEEVDFFCRLYMRPVDRAQFLDILARRVKFWLPDGFKPGLYNWPPQYFAYMVYSEEFKRMFLTLAIEEMPDYAEKVPLVDSKEDGLVGQFRKGLPKFFADFFFKLLPKPATRNGKWNDFLAFLKAFNDVCHNTNRDYAKVRAFMSMYNEQGAVESGKLRSLSLYSQQDPDEVLDGDPLVLTSADLEEERDDAVFFALHNIEKSIPTMATRGLEKMAAKPGCWVQAVSANCVKGSACRFSHNPADLRAKVKEISHQIAASPFKSLETSDME
jgi:hypothetical protein